jgi:zinc resistance-associated protein
LKKSNLILFIMIFSLSAILLLGVNSFADKGQARYGKDCGNYGQGFVQDREKRNYSKNISDDVIKKIGEEKNDFYEKTKDLRLDLREKKLALATELKRISPDINKASSIQKEISMIESNIDQIRIKHIVLIKKIAPDAFGKVLCNRDQKGCKGSSIKAPCR